MGNHVTLTERNAAATKFDGNKFLRKEQKRTKFKMKNLFEEQRF